MLTFNTKLLIDTRYIVTWTWTWIDGKTEFNWFLWSCQDKGESGMIASNELAESDFKWAIRVGFCFLQLKFYLHIYNKIARVRFENALKEQENRGFFFHFVQRTSLNDKYFLKDTRKKLSEMENKRKNSGEEAERLRNALQEAQVR